MHWACATQLLETAGAATPPRWQWTPSPRGRALQLRHGLARSGEDTPYELDELRTRLAEAEVRATRTDSPASPTAPWNASMEALAGALDAVSAGWWR